MLSTSIRILKQYFNDFAEQQEIAFVYGPAKKLVQKSKSSADFQYPILHLNRPVVASVDNGMSNLMQCFHVEVVCLQKYSSKGEPSAIDESQIDADAMTFDVILALEKKMIEDNEEGIIYFSLNECMIEPVSDTFIDYHWGWKMSFKIDFYSNSKLQ